MSNGRNVCQKILTAILVSAFLFVMAGCGSEPATESLPAPTTGDKIVETEAFIVEETVQLESDLPVSGELMAYPSIPEEFAPYTTPSADPEANAFNTAAKRKEVSAIIFKDTLDGAPADAVDASAAQDGSVRAWTVPAGEYYDLYIAADGGVYAPADCTLLFADMENLSYIEFGSAFITDNVNSMKAMFCKTGLQELDLSKFNTSNVTDMSHLFCDTDLVAVNLSSFDTSNVVDMSYMFNSCDLGALDVSNFDTSNVTNMANMFAYNMFLPALDVSGFDTSKVTKMSGMFTMNLFIKELDVSGFNTENVTDMYSMFMGCGITSIDVSGFDTSKVTNMSMMFANSGLTTIDITNFDTSNVQFIGGMFQSCNNLKEIKLPEMVTDNVISYDNFMDFPKETWEHFFQ